MENNGLNTLLLGENGYKWQWEKSGKSSKNWKTAILVSSKYVKEPSKKFKNQLVRNQVNYSPGTDQPKIRLARQLPNCVVEGGEFG